MSGLHLLAVWILLRSGLAQNCIWDPSVDPNQGLNPTSLAAGARILGAENAEFDRDGCLAACCAHPDCDLALLGAPADGGAQCLLVGCRSRGHDVCTLSASTQFQVFRRSREDARDGGDAPHVVPLVGGSWKSQSNDTDRCRLPMKVGPCRAAFPKFFYNVSSQSCSSFIYGGCDANANHFDSAADCEAACSGVTGSVLPEDPSPAPPVKAPRMAPAAPADPEDSRELQKTEMTADEYAERCEAEPLVGPCRAALRHWYHNKDTGTCEQFLYGGCRGNKNNYWSEDTCKATCTGVSVLRSSQKARGEDEGLCGLKPEAGPCRAAFTKFFYDSSSASCHAFLYGGCKGNANNFNTEEECMSRCSGDGWSDSHGTARSRWTAATFLFVALAAISALLLVTLVVFTLRHRGVYRSASSHSDKEELLPDEQSSVDSLTIPDSPGPGLKA